MMNGKNLRLNSRLVYNDSRPLSLSWEESTWKPEIDNYSDARGKKLSRCFDQRWVGLRLHLASRYELRAVKSVCNDSSMIMVTHGGGVSGAIIEYLDVEQENVEVWFATEELILDAHKVLCSLPVRSRWAMTNLPVDPLIKRMLRGLNYTCFRDITKDTNGHHRRMMGVISVQEFDNVDKMLAILALTL